MRQGLKRVAHRRDDALTGVRWDRLEHLLAAYYRDAGYQVTVSFCGLIAGEVQSWVWRGGLCAPVARSVHASALSKTCIATQSSEIPG